MKKTTILCAILLMVTLCTIAQNKKDLQATIDQLNTKIADQAKTIESLQLQLTTANNTIALLQQTMEKKQSGDLVTAKDSVADVILKFRACEEWEECLQYVMEPERVKPLMQSYYLKIGYSSKELDMKTIKNGLVKLKENLYITKGFGIGGYYVVKTHNDYKIDWEATWEYNPIELLELENMPGKTIEWRGQLKYASRPSSTITYEDGTKEEQYNYDNNKYNRYSIFGGDYLFARRETKVDKDLFEIMKDGEYHSVIVKVKRTRDGDGDSFNEIVEVVSKYFSKY